MHQTLYFDRVVCRSHHERRKFQRPQKDRKLQFETLESRVVFDIDYGDAPDDYAGTGTANLNYLTQIEHNGPRHQTGGPTLGRTVDGEPTNLGWIGIFQDEGWANRTRGLGDNAFGADEDGVFFPDLLYSSPSVDTQSRVTIETNTMAGRAYLNGWIDFNSDGDFTDPREQIIVDLQTQTTTSDHPFTIPAGATPGKSYARFRISSSPGLGSIGVLSGGVVPDGEVEDYAILIGGGSGALDSVAKQILAHLTPNGRLKGGNDIAFYYPLNGANNDWYMLEPYFATYGARALMAAPTTATITDALKFKVVADQFDFWLTEPSPLKRAPNVPENDRNAVLTRLYVDSTGNALNSPVCGWVDTTKPCETINPEKPADADDSALAGMLTLAKEFAVAGGPMEVLNRHRAKLELLGNTLRHMIQTNGLTYGHVDPAAVAAYPFQLTMDNFEVREGLRNFAILQRDFFLDPITAAEYDADADRVTDGLNSLFNGEEGLYQWYSVFGPITSVPDPQVTDCLYPISMIQAFPVITDFVAADSMEARGPLQKIFELTSDQPLAWYRQTISGSIAWASLSAGFAGEARKAVPQLLQWALQNSAPYPAISPCATPEPERTAASLGDFAFLLQTLLPAANDDHRATPLNTTVDLDVRANDYSLIPNADLTLQISRGPSAGSASVVNGRIRYVPNLGFQGKDSLTYRVTAPDGGYRSAQVTIAVGAPWHNPHPGRRSDVNEDGAVDAQDVLWVVYLYNLTGGNELPWPVPAGLPYQKVDVTGNNRVEPDDVLYAIVDYNAATGGEGEANFEAGAAEPDIAQMQFLFGTIKPRKKCS